MPVRRRKRPDLTLPTASMGDIAFLLIIFFVLASNFMKSANLDAQRPTSPDVDPVEDAPVSVTLDTQGKTYIQGLEITPTELESAVLQALGDHRDRPVHLTVDRNLKRAQYMPAIEALGSAGVKVVLLGDKQ